MMNTESVNDIPEQIAAPASNKAATYLSEFFSIVLNPFVVPLYAMLVCLYGNTYIAQLPGNTKLYVLAVVVLNTMVIPALSVLLLKLLGMIPDLSLMERRTRTIPLLISAICYVICIYMLSNLYFGAEIRKFIMAALACLLIATIVNTQFKISLHMTGIGALLGIFLSVNGQGLGMLFMPIILTVAGAGCLATSRMYLGFHTPAQVTAGFFCGVVISCLTIYLA